MDQSGDWMGVLLFTAASRCQSTPTARDVPRSGATGEEHQNVFDELKNQ